MPETVRKTQKKLNKVRECQKQSKNSQKGQPKTYKGNECQI